jgi:hypothetical protein
MSRPRSRIKRVGAEILPGLHLIKTDNLHVVNFDPYVIFPSLDISNVSPCQPSMP